MSLLDQIDPNLAHVVEELRQDPTSLYYRGGPRSKRLESERLRPVSRTTSGRLAEAYLLETSREELATWLLRGVFAEWQRLDPLGSAYRCEEQRPARLAWTRDEMLGSRAEIEGWGLAAGSAPPADDARRGLGLLDTLGRGKGDLQALLEACALSHALAPLPEAGLFAAQVLVACREWGQALEVAAGVEAREGRPDLQRSKFTWMGLAAWRRGNLGLAERCFLDARLADDSPKLLAVHYNVLVAEAAAGGAREAWGRFEDALGAHSAACTEGARCMIQSLERGHRENPLGLSGLTLSRLLRVGPEWIRQLQSNS